VSRVDGVVLGGGFRQRRLSWREATYGALDLETTGLDAQRDAIVSFGVVPVERARVRLDAATYQVVDPGIEMSARSITLHGIRPVDLKDAPPFAEVADELRSALWRRVILAWTSWVEAGFLKSALGGRTRSWLRHVIDVRLLTEWLDRLEGRSPPPAHVETLAATASRMGVPPDREHHALWDSFVTAELFIVVASRLEQLGHDRLRTFLVAGRRAPFLGATPASRRPR
jgi:DNA polymerase III subunit epsilon